MTDRPHFTDAIRRIMPTNDGSVVGSDELGVGTGSSEWRDGKEGGDGRKVKRAKEQDEGMGEEELLAAGGMGFYGLWSEPRC